MTDPKDYFERALRVELDGIEVSRRYAFRRAMELCESPIEALIAVEMIFSTAPVETHDLDNPPWAIERDSGQVDEDLLQPEWMARAVVVPQRQIGKYRVDFCLLAREPRVGIVRLVVECDGHEFHDRTKEQAQRDKSRDRHLATLGYPVMRFTGREITRSPAGCMGEIDDFLLARLSEMRDAKQ